MRFTRRLVLLVIIVGGLFRLLHWGAPLTSDEGYMLRAYAAGSPAYIATAYDAPNNHILLSLMLHGIDAVWPKKLIRTLASPAPLQAPSIFSSIASLWLVAELGSLMAGPIASLFATIFFAFSYWHLMYAHMLRGYSLSVFFETCALWLALMGLKRGKPHLLIGAAFSAACANYLIPSNVAFTFAAAVAFGILLKLQPRRPEGARQSKTKWRPTLSARSLGLAAVICAFITVALYSPILGSVLRQTGTSGFGDSLSQLPKRLFQECDILGVHSRFAILVAVLAAVAIAVSVSAGGRGRAAAIACLTMITLPLFIFTALRVSPPARVYLPVLPAWCLALGLGVRHLLTPVLRTLGRGKTRLVVLAVTLVVAVGMSGEVSAYFQWNRGLDPRTALLRLVSDTMHTDDFIVIVTDRGDDPRFGEISWDYYGFASGLEPYMHLALDSGLSYRTHSQYFVLARDDGEAQAALERSGVDFFLRGAMRKVRQEGRLSLFETSRTAAVVREYESVAFSSGALISRQVDALVGLAASEEQVRLGRARQLLERATRLMPLNAKARFQLGLTDYLAFNDRDATTEMEWVVKNDTSNVDAPFVLADCYAQLRSSAKAAEWYGWYFSPGRPPQAWKFSNMAKLGLAALKAGQGAVPLPATQTANAWIEVAKGNYRKGAFPRVVEALDRSLAIQFSPDAIIHLADALEILHDYASAATALRSAIAHGAPPNFRIELARALRDKGDFDGARRELLSARSFDPPSPEAIELAADLQRR